MSNTSDRDVSRNEPTSTKRALAFVYFGYAFRYLHILILVPFYGRVLGAAEYGRILAATSLLQIVWMLTEYSLPTVGARDLAKAREPREIAVLYSSHLLGRLALTPIVLLIGLGAALLSPVLRERPLYGLLAVLNGVVMAYNLGWFFQGTLRFRTSVLLEVLGFATSLPLILLLVRGPEDGWLVLGSLLASGVLATVVAHAVALRSIERSALRWRGGVQLLRDSAVLFVHKGLSVMMTSSSTYLISLFATASQVGWYGAAERMINAAMGLLLPAHQVLMRTAAFRISARESEHLGYALVRKSVAALTGFSLCMLIGALLLAEFAVPLILGPEFGPSVPLLQILSVLFPFAALSQVIVGYVFIPLCLDGLVAKISLVCAVATLVSVVLLGHVFGAVGVAWARTLGTVLLALVLVEALRRKQLLRKSMPFY